MPYPARGCTGFYVIKRIAENRVTYYSGSSWLKDWGACWAYTDDQAEAMIARIEKRFNRPGTNLGVLAIIPVDRLK